MRGLCFAALAVLLSASLGTVQAKQYIKKIHGKEVVVHTSPIPVVLHRIVPPQHGRHMTERELQQGKAPQGGRYLGSFLGR